ncbi:MAG: ABC transporter substrate-binding protein [Synechocystis sp.]
MSSKNETSILVATLFITLAIIGGGVWFLNKLLNAGNSSFPKGEIRTELKQNISTGSTILVPSANNEAKQFAAKAIAEGKKNEAIQQLSDYLQRVPNDPEALIYLNNLRAIDHDPLNIAVVAPVGSSLNVAQEILRGTAQAQMEINQQGGIKGRFLRITLVNDANQTAIAQEVAQALVKTPEIVAVVGHNASSASLSAAPIYQTGELVMITPTSFANGITDIGNYIFRVVPNVSVAAKSLVQQVSKRHQKIAVCSDSQAPDAVSFYQEFTANLLAAGRQLVPTVCDLNAPVLNAPLKIQEALNSGADGLLLLPHVDRLVKAYDMAAANQGRLQLYGNSTLFTIKTLEQGKAMQGLIIAVPWSSKNRVNRPFAQAARQLWGGDVSWRTAGAYDAVYAVANGLKVGQTRQALQRALAQPTFVSKTINGDVSFLPNGDRTGQAIIVQIQPAPSHVTGYDFTPITP